VDAPAWRRIWRGAKYYPQAWATRAAAAIGLAVCLRGHQTQPGKPERNGLIKFV
jgi:hypothetical protein